MKHFKNLMESLPAKTVVFAFGRFNPPTTGHELLVKFVKKLAKSSSADHVIYASGTQDKKKNPLPVDKKVHYLNLMFPSTNFVAAGGTERTFIEAAKHLNKKYRNLIMVAGSDRVAEYDRLLNKQNGIDFNFDSIKVMSAGERDADSDDASGMSASKMRAAASKGDYSTFKKGLPSTLRDIDGKRLMNDVRAGLGLEHIKENIKFQPNALREAYLAKQIFNIGDIVESAGTQFEIVDRGSNYLTVVDGEGQTHRKWLHECAVAQAVVEDVQPGYAPDEISFKGFTTKNLHHSADAAKAFQGTIERYGKLEPATVLAALKATDTYMKINDMHLEQGEPPDESDLAAWRDAHQKARDSLNRVGEFIHHQDYWHMHEHEIQDMEANYNVDTAGAEMADSYEPQGDLVEAASPAARFNQKVKQAQAAHEAGDHKKAKYHLDTARSFMLGINSNDHSKIKDSYPKYKELRDLHKEELEEELTNKTIKSGDKIKVARVIADMLGVENAETLSPEVAVNTGLRKIKNKRMTPELIGVVKKMLTLAQEVGIKVDATLIPKVVSEDVVNKGSTYNVAKDILRYKDFAKLKKMNGESTEVLDVEDDDGVEVAANKVGHTLHSNSPEHDTIRRMKVAYKTESFTVKDPDGKVVHTAYSQGAAKKKASELSAETGKEHTTDYDREAMVKEETVAEGSLEEMDRRGFLKGLVGAGTALAAGSAIAKGAKVITPHYDKREKEREKARPEQPGNYQQIPKPKPRDSYNSIPKEGVEEGLVKDIKRLATGKDVKSRAGQEIAKSQDASMKGDTKTSKKHFDRFDKLDKLANKTPNKKSSRWNHNDVSDVIGDVFEDMASADYKVNPMTGRKYRAHKIEFANSGMKDKLDPEQVKEEVEEDDFSEDDLEAMANGVTEPEHVLDAYDDSELVIVDTDTGEEVDTMVEEVEQINEVLSRIERMKAKIRFARTASKRERRVQVALRTRSTSTKINARARRLAVSLMKQRIIRKPVAQMTVQEKERAEAIIARRKEAIGRLAMKLAPRVRKIENDRLSHSKVTK